MTIDRLHGAYHLSRNTRGRDRWTAEQWLQLYDAYKACGWDFTPCQWAWWQVDAALRGVVPQWDDDEKPIPPEVSAKDVSRHGVMCPCCGTIAEFDIECDHCLRMQSHSSSDLEATPECPHCEAPWRIVK